MGPFKTPAARSRHLSALRAFCISTVFLASSIACAGPADRVYLPQVDYHELEFEFRGGVQDWSGHADDGLQGYVADIGYGLTPWWSSEVAFAYQRPRGASTKLDEIEWENIFLLTDPGRYWLDVGLFAELARDRGERKNEIEIGPMLQKAFGHAQVNLNLLLKRGIGRADEADEIAAQGGEGTELAYAFQWKWRGNHWFEPGLQALGSFGHFGNLHLAENKIGPAFFGVARIDSRSKLRYDAGLLFGTTNGSPDTTLRFNLEYEFR